MEFENLSCFDAVRLSLRTALGKEPKLRRLPKHVQKEMKCQRIRSNARRWKTGRVYSETVEIDSAKEGYGEKDVFSGDVPYPQVSVETHHLLGEKTPPSHASTLGRNVLSSSPSTTSSCPSPEQLRNSRPAPFETCSQLSHTFHRHAPSSAGNVTSNVLTSSISDTSLSGSEEAGSQTEVPSVDDKPIAQEPLCPVADKCAKNVKDIWGPFSKPVMPKPHVAGDTNWDAINKARDRVGMLRLDDFRPVKRLGSGATGCVHLAELKGTRCFFAIKAVDKADLIARDKVHNVNTEREILGMMDHPSLPTLYAAFQTPSHVCLVTDFCSGGELYGTLDKQGGARVPEEAARLFCVQVVAALGYLHRRGVVYRDLKPENILVSASGHLILTDFDLSLVQPPARPADAGWERRDGGVGTEEYMAPEMIRGPTHGTPVDWWSFGVLLFEMLYGRTPFVGPTLKETLMNVLRNRLSFPRSVSVSSEAKHLMAALLTKQPEARLGSKMGAIEIRAHPFFAGVDWGNLGRSEVPKLEVPVEHYDPLAACPLTDSCPHPDWASGTNQGVALSFSDH